MIIIGLLYAFIWFIYMMAALIAVAFVYAGAFIYLVGSLAYRAGRATYEARHSQERPTW